MTNPISEVIPAANAGMESTDLAGTQAGHESETKAPGTEAEQETDSKPEGTAEGTDKAEGTETDDKAKDPEFIKASVFKKRIGKTTAKLRTAEERNTILEEQMRVMSAKIDGFKNPAQELPIKEAEDFATTKEYVDYLVEKKSVEKEKIANDAMNETNQRNQKAQETNRVFEAKIETARSALPKDFDSVVNSMANVRLSPSFFKEIESSEYSPEFVYYFASHPEEAQIVNEMTAREQGNFITDLEGDFKGNRSASSKKATSQAPPPTPASRGGGGGPVDIYSLNNNEFHKAWKKRKEARRKK